MTEIKILPNGMAQATKEDGWISVDIETGNYPASYQECWLCSTDNKVYYGWVIHFNNDPYQAEWYFDCSAHTNLDLITHYMPIVLPSPPTK